MLMRYLTRFTGSPIYMEFIRNANPIAGRVKSFLFFFVAFVRVPSG